MYELTLTPISDEVSYFLQDKNSSQVIEQFPVLPPNEYKGFSF
jgi:hypothetical protein